MDVVALSFQGAFQNHFSLNLLSLSRSLSLRLSHSLSHTLKATNAIVSSNEGKSMFPPNLFFIAPWKRNVFPADSFSRAQSLPLKRKVKEQVKALFSWEEFPQEAELSWLDGVSGLQARGSGAKLLSKIATDVFITHPSPSPGLQQTAERHCGPLHTMRFTQCSGDIYFLFFLMPGKFQGPYPPKFHKHWCVCRQVFAQVQKRCRLPLLQIQDESG